MNRNSAVWLTEHDLGRLRHLIADLGRQARDLPAGAEALEELLDLGRVVKPQDIPHNVVTMNSKIVFEELQTREKRTVTVVYPEDADPVAGKISVLSPVGIALLGLAEGTEAELPLPHGRTARIGIREISYQPEANGVYTL